MKAVSALIAAAFAAGVASLAAAQPQSDSAPPPMQFVQEPIASASRTEGADGERAKPIVDAMNGDASLKDSKITVQPTDDGTITLTGATMTQAQVKRAGDIATQQAGEGKVINTILPSEAPVAPR